VKGEREEIGERTKVKGEREEIEKDEKQILDLFGKDKTLRDNFKF